MNTDKIVLVGLGKLGLPLAAVFAQKIQVLGLDLPEKIDTLERSWKFPFEKNLEEYVSKSKDLKFCDINSFDINYFDIAIILVGTPSDKDGNFSNLYVEQVIKNLAEKLRDSDKKDFLFILSSTVMPLSCENFIKQIEQITNRKVNEGFGFSYVPDLVALGNVIHDFENPDLLILGSSNEKYGNITESLYKKIIKNNCPIHQMSLLEAEITKVSLNTYITTKISFANFLGTVCQTLGANCDKITKALGCDKRISPYYLKAGLPFGGACFPRDTKAFIRMSENLGLFPDHIKATELINQLTYEYLVSEILDYKDKIIGILGISFKPETEVTEGSISTKLINNLRSMGCKVAAYDKLVKSNEQFSILESEVIVLMHPDVSLLRVLDTKDRIIINPWNLKIN